MFNICEKCSLNWGDLKFIVDLIFVYTLEDCKIGLSMRLVQRYKIVENPIVEKRDVPLIIRVTSIIALCHLSLCNLLSTI